MSTEKGELIGIMRTQLEDEAKAAIHTEPRGDALVAVALAAQKAVATWLLAGHGEWLEDVPEAGGTCYGIYETDMKELCAKLGVTP